MASELQALVDCAAVERLIYRYANAVDVFDVDAVMELFASDARVELDDGDIIAVGDDDVRSLYATFFSRPTEGAAHQMSNVLVDVDGDTATARTFLIAYLPGTEKVQVRGIRYADKLTRIRGEWKFSARKHRVLWQFEAPISETTNHRDIGQN